MGEGVLSRFLDGFILPSEDFAGTAGLSEDFAAGPGPEGLMLLLFLSSGSDEDLKGSSRELDVVVVS